MNRSAFYASARERASGVFGTSLSQKQVEGCEAIINEAERRGTPLTHVAYILATAYHETGALMQPVRENLNYTSAARIKATWPSRFPTTASAEPYVRNPRKLANKVYGGRLGNTGPDDGWIYRGDGLPQLTGKENFKKFGVSPGMDLLTAVRVMFDGMEKGKFTGKKLSDFITDEKADYYSSRVIVNGDKKKNGAKIATEAKAFENALRAAGYDGKPSAVKPAIPVSPAPIPDRKAPNAIVSLLALGAAALAAFGAYLTDLFKGWF